MCVQRAGEISRLTGVALDKEGVRAVHGVHAPAHAAERLAPQVVPLVAVHRHLQVVRATEENVLWPRQDRLCVVLGHERRLVAAEACVPAPLLQIHHAGDELHSVTRVLPVGLLSALHEPPQQRQGLLVLERLWGGSQRWQGLQGEGAQQSERGRGRSRASEGEGAQQSEGEGVTVQAAFCRSVRWHGRSQRQGFPCPAAPRTSGLKLRFRRK